MLKTCIGMLVIFCGLFSETSRVIRDIYTNQWVLPDAMAVIGVLLAGVLFLILFKDKKNLSPGTN